MVPLFDIRLSGRATRSLFFQPGSYRMSFAKVSRVNFIFVVDPFIQFCRQLSPLDASVTAELSQGSIRKIFRKGEFILRQGEICRHLFFVHTGLIKLSFYKEDKEFISRFFFENLLFTVFDSYLTQTPSKFDLIVLETATITLVRYEKIDRLCKEYHCMETFLRKLISVASVKMVTRIREMLEQNATEQYERFVIENAHLLGRINLSDLAKYLGITQPSLSRIRTAR